MKRLLACLLCLALLAPTMASAATPVLPLNAETLATLAQPGNEPAYIVLVPEEVAANAQLLEEALAYPTPMGMEAPRGPVKAQGPKMAVLGIPPLIWGLVLSIPGVIVVRTQSEERIDTQKALMGAGINLAILTVLYFTVISPVTKGN